MIPISSLTFLLWPRIKISYRHSPPTPVVSLCAFSTIFASLILLSSSVPWSGRPHESPPWNAYERLYSPAREYAGEVASKRARAGRSANTVARTLFLLCAAPLLNACRDSPASPSHVVLGKPKEVGEPLCGPLSLCLPSFSHSLDAPANNRSHCFSLHLPEEQTLSATSSVQ